MNWRHLALLLGIFACSSAAIMIKASDTHPVVLSAMRLLLAAALLSPLFWIERNRHHSAYTREHLRRSFVPALVLALHFISWAWGARMILAAQATLIVNLVPVAMPFFLHRLVGERINRMEIIGTIITLAGLGVLSLRDALAEGGSLLGNAICFSSMLLFAWYLALGRRNRDFPSLWLYVVPVYALAGGLCLLAALPWVHTFALGSAREWALMAGLACIPTIIGHSLLNQAMRHFRGQTVSLANVGQFVFAGIMGWFLFRESPAATFYFASLLVVSGIALAVLAAPTPPPRLR